MSEKKSIFKKTKVEKVEKVEEPLYKKFVKIENKNEEYEIKDIESYGEITLRIGKYAGCRIMDIIEGDEKYAKWLYTNSISSNEYDSPTNKAIKKYFKHKLNV